MRAIEVIFGSRLIIKPSNVHSLQYPVGQTRGSDYATSPRPLPQLPPEIWLMTFRKATWIPGTTRLSDRDEFTAYARDDHGLNLYIRHRQAMDTKLSLSLVSKSWRILAAEFLYEYIVIKNGEQACQVNNVFKHDGYHLGQQTYSSCTTRIDLALEDVHVWEDHHTSAVVSILKHCSNLVTFSTAFSTAEAYLFYPSTFLQALVPLRDLKKLRRLELRGDVNFLNDIVSQVTEEIEILWLLPPPKGSRRNESLSLCLPKLRTLKMSFIEAKFTLDWQMPSLENYSTGEVVYLPQHLEANGSHLRWVAIPKPAFVITTLSFCPNLLELDIQFGGTSLVPFNWTCSHTNLRRILFEGCPDFSRPISWYKESNSSHLKCLRTSLLTLINGTTFPALECIRLVLSLNWIPYDGEPPDVFTHIWDFWLDSCTSRGIRVEVSVGASDHTADIWQPFSSSMLLRTL
ncbi:hypothetical protein NEOLEDRAFT_1091295 [Neolentinus lepideus HHB14362 ss-1]|uniref:F-box domain-containing protein n=1 Tax=Neolentinus lepideus HHB14362 ss-1 TaxID=1314782 RepID=A0A165TAF9_9AGAM|nr:hypothetical protein NEOLEDRAFT_1091295 [Neolentinus lepideus HHB14362 ss-1]